MRGVSLLSLPLWSHSRDGDFLVAESRNHLGDLAWSGVMGLRDLLRDLAARFELRHIGALKKKP